jgi:hypothetical protein
MRGMRHHAGVNLRTVLLVLATVLLVTSVLGALAPRDDQARKPDRPLRPAPAAAAPDAPADGTARGVLPRDKVLRARVGQLVELTVTATAPDSATFDGLTDAVAPGSPATFSFVADAAGSYPVSLSISDDRVGRVVVAPAREGVARAPAGATGGVSPADAPPARRAPGSSSPSPRTTGR